MKEGEICLNKETKVGENELTHERDALPSCIDELREEFSCAICLEICFEPSTTPCGHSFCRSCLLRVTLKCDKKCPKCRQLISIGSSRTVNAVMWNTIQLLFPKEVEARKIAFKNAKIATFSIRQAAPRNVQPFAESLFGFSDKLSCFSPGDVIEMKLEVMEYNQEEMGLAIKELKLAEPTNQTPSSILFKRFWKIVKSTKIFCM